MADQKISEFVAANPAAEADYTEEAHFHAAQGGADVWVKLSTLLELNSRLASATGADFVRQGFDALIAAGSSPLDALVATLTDMLVALANGGEGLIQVGSSGVSVTPGGAVAPATAAQIRQAVAGLLLVTPAELDAAKAQMDITALIAGGVIPVDGHAWWNGIATASAAVAIGAATNLKNEILRLRVVASGADRVVTPDASYTLRNITGTVTVPNGKTALFLVEKVGASVELTYGGTTA